MRRLLGPTLAVLAVVALISVEVVGDTSGDHAPQAAPALPGEVLLPPRVTLTDLRGKPAAINFWASWCQPCREEMPQLERLSRALHGRANLVGVDYSDDRASARSFLRDLHLTYPNLRDASGEVGDSYGLAGLPTTVILDPRGRIVERLHGPQTAADVRAALRAAGSP